MKRKMLALLTALVMVFACAAVQAETATATGTATVKGFGGICYPAHVDRESNGAIAVLGFFPDDCGFTAAEFHDGGNIDSVCTAHPSVAPLMKIVSSDAHYLWNIKEKKEYFELDDEPYSSDRVRRSMFELLGGAK